MLFPRWEKTVWILRAFDPAIDFIWQIDIDPTQVIDDADKRLDVNCRVTVDPAAKIPFQGQGQQARSAPRARAGYTSWEVTGVPRRWDCRMATACRALGSRV